MTDNSTQGLGRRNALKLLGATTVVGGLGIAGAPSAAAAVWPNAFKTISSSGTHSAEFSYYFNTTRTLVWYRVSEGWSLTSTTSTLNFITVKNLGTKSLYFAGLYSADGGTPTVNTGAFRLDGSASRTFYPRRLYNKGSGTKITTQVIQGSTLADTPFRNGIEWRRS